MTKHTRAEWLAIWEIDMMDDDGWRGEPFDPNLKISLEEFVIRLNESTMRPMNHEKFKMLQQIAG